MISAAQIRAGRAILRWTQADLAKASGVSAIAIKKIEGDQVKPRKETLYKLRAALADAGVDCTSRRSGEIDIEGVYRDVTARFPKILARLAE